MLELPSDFIHEPPEGFHYEVDQFRRNVHRICIINDGSFSYTDVAPKSVWGFVKYKTTKRSSSHTYYAPINSNKIGNEVDIKDTRPYSAMQINYKGLEAFFN